MTTASIEPATFMAAPPFGIIARCLNNGQVVPFLGAGASLVPASVPNVASTTDTPAPSEVSSAARRWNRLPTGSELANLLADESQFPSVDVYDRSDLSKVASYYADVSGRKTLRLRLHGLLDLRASPGPIHRQLASIKHPMLIVTTNYDCLMEQALEEAKKPYDLVVYPADKPSLANAVLWSSGGQTEPKPVPTRELEIDLDKTTVVFKMHGTWSRESERGDHYVITEEDYVEFLSRMSGASAIPSLFYRHFMGRAFLFLGYGLRDWNLRLLLKNLDKRLAVHGRVEQDDDEVVCSWAIQKSPSSLERQLWSSRNVKIFDIALDDFVDGIKRSQLAGSPR